VAASCSQARLASHHILARVVRLAAEFKDIPKDKMRSVIGRFGITGPAQTLAIKHLSDGLKSRVVFAWLAEKMPHMLLLVRAREPAC
jgi:ATPase subunit of ABC transporter with duplicated ATPase domains